MKDYDVRHSSIDIEEHLKMSDVGLTTHLVGVIISPNGTSLKTPSAIRGFLKAHKLIGNKVISRDTCDNFDGKTGCKGHPPVSDITSQVNVPDKKSTIRKMNTYKLMITGKVTPDVGYLEQMTMIVKFQETCKNNALVYADDLVYELHGIMDLSLIH